MLLLLMRHADAAPADNYTDDDLRPLTAIGEETQAKVAQALKKMGFKFHHIISSPRLRAWQTASITAGILGLEQVQIKDDALGQAYSVDAVLRKLVMYNEESTILCVGHEPDLRELSGVMLGIAKGAGVKFPKSAVMGIEFRDKALRGRGMLRFFYRPQDLLALL